MIFSKYVEITSREQLIQEAWKSVSIWRKLLDISTSYEFVRGRIKRNQDMIDQVEQAGASGYRFWPFLLNDYTSAMRAGYVITDMRTPIDVLITKLS